MRDGLEIYASYAVRQREKKRKATRVTRATRGFLAVERGCKVLRPPVLRVVSEIGINGGDGLGVALVLAAWNKEKTKVNQHGTTIRSSGDDYGDLMVR